MRRPIIGVVLALAVTLLGGVLAFVQEAPTGRAARPESKTLRIEVDLSTRRLEVLQRGDVIGTYPVTVGMPGHRTPPGDYHIDWIVWNPSWHPPDSKWARGAKTVGPGPDNPMGRVKMFFRKPAYYVHGTSDDEDLGRAASHGCVRMTNDDAIHLARLVMASGGEPRSPGWFRRVINRFRDTREVTLDRPVPVSIRP